MIQEMAKSNKGAVPDMGDLSDVSVSWMKSFLFFNLFEETNIYFSLSYSLTDAGRLGNQKMPVTFVFYRYDVPHVLYFYKK